MNENAPIFTPFTPEAPPLAPAADKPKAKKERRGRRKAVAAPVAEAPAPRQKRKPRAIASVRKPRSMKLPVDTMLAALSSLKGDDGALFEKLLGILNAAGKPQRARVMAALAKVFA